MSILSARSEKKIKRKKFFSRVLLELKSIFICGKINKVGEEIKD